MLRLHARRLCAAAGGGSSGITGAEFARGKAVPRRPTAEGRELSMEEQEEIDSRSRQPRAAQGGEAAAAAGSRSHVGTLATVTPASHAPTRWMQHSSWAAMGEEFKSLDDDKFLRPVPEGFLTARAVTDIRPAEELLSTHLQALKESYEGLDVRDPKTMLDTHQGDPTYVKTSLTMGDKVRAVAEFMSGNIAHQVALPQWQRLFDLSQVEMDLQFWLWIIHLHLISRRAVTVNINAWARRREVLQELLQNMFDAWVVSTEQIVGKRPLAKIRNYVKDMYYVSALNFDEALAHDGPGGDMMLVGALMKFCPLPRPEDVPLFTYYTLVHYIRFHTALFDRLTDEEFAKGNFHFLPPDDRTIFAAYSDVEFDDVAKAWMAEGEDGNRAAAEAEPKSGSSEAADQETTPPDAAGPEL